MRSFGVIAVLGALALTGCADSKDGAAQTGRVHGIVRNGATNDGIGGVSIRFTADTLETASDETNGDGEYSLDVRSESRKGRIEAKKSGYQTRVVSVYLDDTEVAVNIELTKTEASAKAK